MYPGSWWWTGWPGVLRFMGSQRVGHNWATELNWTEYRQVVNAISWREQKSRKIYCVGQWRHRRGRISFKLGKVHLDQWWALGSWGDILWAPSILLLMLSKQQKLKKTSFIDIHFPLIYPHPLSKISMIVCSKTLSFITEIHISILFISKSTEWEAEDLHLGDVGGSPS